MPTDDILIRFKADTGQLKAEFDGIAANLRKVAEEEKKADTQSKVTSKEISEAAKRRNTLLAAEINVLKQLEQQSKKAFTPGQIKEFNDRISQSQKNISLLKGEGDKLAGSNSLLGQSFAKLGGLIVTAFSVQQITAWAQTTLAAYKEQEKALAQLSAALNTVANEGTDAFNRLVEQAERLQDTSIFSDEQIEQVQTMLINFGLTSRQTETLTNRIVDFASRTGKSIEEASGIFIRAIEGQQRGLVDSGARFDDTGTKVGNFNALLEATQKFAGGAATALNTQAGQLQNVANQIDDINEETGRTLANTELFFAKTQLVFARFIDAFTSGRLFGVGGFSLKELFFGKEPPTQLPKELDNVAKALEAINARREKAFQASLGKSVLGFTDQEIKDEIKRLNSLDEANTIAVKDRIDALNKVLELRQKNSGKIADLEKQELAERQKAQEALRKFTLQSLQDGITEQETIRKLAIANTITNEKKFNEAILQADIETLEERRNLLIEFGEPTAQIEKQIADLKIEQIRRASKETKEIFDEDNKERADQYDEDVENFKEAQKEKEEAFLRTIDKISEASRAFNDLFSALNEAQIQKITESEEAQTESFDEQQERLQDLLDNRRITQDEFDKQSKTLAENRAKNEKINQDKIKALQLEQAKRNKELAIFEATLNLAKAISVALSAAPPPFNAALAAISAALAGVQLAAVIATPIPAFKKGTKNKPGSGLARVGEDGEEIMFVPSGAKILPAQKTRQYSDVLDSMFDGNLDKYIHEKYVLPALKQNIVVNNGFNEKKLAKLIKQRDSISIDNLHELAEMFDHNPRRVI